MDIPLYLGLVFIYSTCTSSEKVIYVYHVQRSKQSNWSHENSLKYSMLEYRQFEAHLHQQFLVPGPIYASLKLLIRVGFRF